jgi:hypothetical protein
LSVYVEKVLDFLISMVVLHLMRVVSIRGQSCVCYPCRSWSRGGPS